MGRIAAVCISEKKGTPKKDIGKCLAVKGFGMANDAHAGSERQVSLLPLESVVKFREKAKGIDIPCGTFGENILTEGIDYEKCSVGTRLRCGEALLEITQIGKSCHSDCLIRQTAGDCIMPREGVFAKVLEGGYITVGDGADIAGTKPLSAAVITASDRAYFGGYKDESGTVIQEICGKHGYTVIKDMVCCDNEDDVYRNIVDITDNFAPDLLITTGGTGFSLRDRVPEATLRAADRNAPGIAEAIRAYSMTITPKAMLSRAVSVIRGRTLIINLPGSPKAVQECLEYVLPHIGHGIELLRGEADK